MSSMISSLSWLISKPSLLGASFIALAAASPAQPGSTPQQVDASPSDPGEWDRARLQLLSQEQGTARAAINRWERLSAAGNAPFREYASFLLTYPDFPDEAKFRRNAEKALDLETIDAGQVIAFFDKYEPLTNSGRARYAIALANTGDRDKGATMARAAWRGGALTDADELRLIGLYPGAFTLADHDARMDALLWQNSLSGAERQLNMTSAERRPVFAARLAMAKGAPDAPQLTAAAGPDAMKDAGFVASRATWYRRQGDSQAALSLLATRPPLAHYPADPEEWYEVLLGQAREAASGSQWTLAYEIASKVDDAFPEGHDISSESLGVRDDYTSLTWLAGTAALWERGKPADAIGMFARYGNAAQTPQTRSKGFYWAGRAAAAANERDVANQYFEMASEYPEYFYGQLALERLGRDLPPFADEPNVVIAPLDRGEFNARPVVQAVREVARQGDWRTQARFFTTLANDAETPADHALVAELAREIGRRDLAVVVGRGAREHGLDGFQSIAFPQMPVPPGYESNWTLIHAITRQESQFSQNAVSSAKARGLMQLLPSTAQEQAGKIGLSYSFGALTDDPLYNIQLGSSYYSRMRDYYGGSWPLAAAAYNAGPGNVNKWLRANGDPRTGEIGILEWIEKIPIYETKNYVQRVMENAVVYDSLNPRLAIKRGPNKLSQYLGKAPG